MDITLASTVRSALDSYTALGDEERRQFHWAIQNPSKAAQGEPPPVREKDPWDVFTLVNAYQPRPPVEYIAAGLFALPSLNIVYGAPGTLKSFLLADLAASAAGGQVWLPPASWQNNGHNAGIPTRQCPVMWLDFDNGRRRTHDRFGALGRAHNLPADTPLFYVSMPSPWLDASNPISIEGLRARMAHLDIRLLLVDNLGVVSGDADENSGDMVGVMSGFRQLAEETGAAVVLIHHQRKSNGGLGRVGDSLRGHSSIEAALDLALLVEREELADVITIKATKVRGADVLPFSAVFTFENRQDGELNVARFFSVTAEDNHSNAAIEREILSALQRASLNKTDLAKTVKENLPSIGINRIREIIDRMASSGKLRVSNGRNNTEKLYQHG